MDILINHGILHIIDNERGQVVLSESELDLDSDMVAEFLTKHIKKIMNSSDVKEATFEADSSVLATLRKYFAKEIDFKATSWDFCVKLSEIMLENGSIPPADLLVTQFEIKGTPHIAIFKLNHSVFYTHEVKGGENHIVQSSFALPLGGAKVTEAVVIPYDPMVLKIMEKPHNVGGEEINYFSKLFLSAGASLSKKQAAKVIKAILEDTVAAYFGKNPIAAAKFQIAMIEEAIENDGEVRLESVTREAFGEGEARDEFLAAAREAGLVSDLFLGEKFCAKEFGTAKIKSESGITLQFPVGILDDPNVIEFIDREGGFSVNVKDFRKN
ncbi:MAG: nucleoid-associated protein [Defluviitaleaceae bacterium]|nr:nucleoid-associated protein [Defluviitaleaceae bacterium]